jgi:replicative DNA helicase
VKNLPVNVDVERLILGSILLNSSQMDMIRANVEPADFTVEKHRLIWVRCCDLYDTGRPLDHVTLASELMDRGEAQAVDGVSYLISLQDGLPQIPNLDGYIEILKSKSTRRRIIYSAQKLALQAMDESVPEQELIEAFGSAAAALVENTGAAKGPMSTHDLITLRGVDRLLSGRQHSGVRLPWPSLEDALMGFGPEQMIVLMAETAKGKTCLALQVAMAAAMQGKTPIIWTLEMSPESMFLRMVNQISGVRGRSPQLSFEQRESQRDAIVRLDEHLIYFDNHSRSVSSFCASVRQVRSRGAVGIAIVDYLQLIRSQGMNRAQEVSNNSRGLKLAAMDFSMPFLVLSQVDRSSVKGGGEINIHSAKESGDIENDADVLLWIKGPELQRDSNTPVNLWVGKQREGPAGFGIPVTFHPQSQTFREEFNNVGR